MSEPTDWAALGAKVQEDATSEDARVAKEQEAAKQAAAQHLQDRRIQQQRAQQALETLKLRCVPIVSAFNMGVGDQILKLSIQDGGSDKFSVTKGHGIPLLSFRAYEGNIHVDLQDSPRATAGGTDQYGVDPEGRLTIRNGAGFIDAERIVEPKIKLLIQTKYRV
jgi:hypothetical protein